jgi:hypothetical protein
LRNTQKEKERRKKVRIKERTKDFAKNEVSVNEISQVDRK